MKHHAEMKISKRINEVTLLRPRWSKSLPLVVSLGVALLSVSTLAGFVQHACAFQSTFTITAPSLKASKSSFPKCTDNARGSGRGGMGARGVFSPRNSLVGRRGRSSSGTSSFTTGLSMMDALEAAGAVRSPLASISVLAFVVLVHEAGHFLAARSMGISVKEFSVGVGPRLLGFNSANNLFGARTKKDADEANGKRKLGARSISIKRTDDGEHLDEGIDFSLRLIPLGGYVQFPENYNRTLANLIEDEEYERRKLERQRRKEERLTKANTTPAPVKKKQEGVAGILSIFAGSTRPSAGKSSKLVTSKAPDNTWKNIFALGANKNSAAPLPAETAAVTEIEYYDDPNLLQNRPWSQRAIVLVGGVVFNLLLAFSLYFGEVTVGSGLPQPVFEQGALISAAPRPDGASYGLLERGDVIVGVNGEKLALSRINSVASSQEAITSFISTIRKTQPGDAVNLEVMKKSKDTQTTTIKVQPRPLVDSSGKIAAGGPPSIGVMLSPNFVRTDRVHAASLSEAFTLAGRTMAQTTSDTAGGITTAIMSLLTGTGDAGMRMSGPVGVIRMGSDVVSTNDLSAIVAFAAAISINLAVVNSLPLPALDGGQLVFVFAEAILGRKIDQRLQENINAFTLFFLLLVTFSTTIGDVGSIISR